MDCNTFEQFFLRLEYLYKQQNNVILPLGLNFEFPMGNDRWKLNQLHLTVHFSKCQTVTALPLIEKLNRYKMILNNILERRNDFEKHFWKIGYSFMAIKGRYNCKYRKSLRPCKHCPLIKDLLLPENAMDGNSNSNHWKN